MSSKKAALSAATGLGLAGLLAACSSGSSSKSTTTTTKASASNSSAGTTATTKAATTAIPAPPSGSTELQNTTQNGVAYQRWSNPSATPAQVVASYQSALASQGFTITNSGGGGGGWGKWGGANAGLSANKNGTYIDVQAGGQTGQPVYFEVCEGTNKSAVDQCENVSNGPSDTKSSGS